MSLVAKRKKEENKKIYIRNARIVKGNMWKPLRSNTCKVCISSAKWQCTCLLDWFACTIHAPPGHLAGNQPVVRASAKHARPSNSHVDAQAPVEMPSVKRRRESGHHNHTHCRPPKRKQGNAHPGGRPKRIRKGDGLDYEAIAHIDRMRALREADKSNPRMGSGSSC